MFGRSPHERLAAAGQASCQGIQNRQPLHCHRVFAHVQAQAFAAQSVATGDAAGGWMGTSVSLRLSSSTRNGIEPPKLMRFRSKPVTCVFAWLLCVRNCNSSTTVKHVPSRRLIRRDSSRSLLFCMLFGEGSPDSVCGSGDSMYGRSMALSVLESLRDINHPGRRLRFLCPGRSCGPAFSPRILDSKSKHPLFPTPANPVSMTAGNVASPHGLDLYVAPITC